MMKWYGTYKICVTARGITADSVQQADDLLDAVCKARELQRHDTRRIEIILQQAGEGVPGLEGRSATTFRDYVERIEAALTPKERATLDTFRDHYGEA